MGLFDQHFLDFLRLLIRHQVDYIVVGGHAVNLYGYPRATGDLDVWVRPDQATAEPLFQVIEAYGFDGALLREQDFTRPLVFNLGMPPDRIELMNHVSGVSFDEAFARAPFFSVGEMAVRVIHLQDLRKNKAASGRHRDLDDLDNLPTAE